MDEEKCSECKNGLVYGEKNQCIYCELTQRTGNKSCPKCRTLVLRDKGSLYCELCKCFYHNSCNEFPLDEQYCTLLYEVPRNVKWFCDKCVWDTEKWISDYSINNSSYSKTDAIDSTNFDVKIIVDQEKPLKSGKKIKKNSKRKKGDSNSGSKKSKKTYSARTRSTKRQVRQNVKKAPIKEEIEENYEPIDVTMTEKDSNHDSTLEAVDLDYHSWESDYDSEKEKKVDPDYDSENKKKEDLLKKDTEKRFQCDQCPKNFLHERSLEQHKNIHSSENPFVCNICGKATTRPDLLKAHMRKVHSEAKPFTCSEPNCDFSCRTKQKLKAHFTQTHRVLNCTLCEFETRKREALNYHIKIHTGELENKPTVMCDECGISLKSYGSLQYHQRLHSGEKPFKCKICEKSFRSKSQVKTHMFVHTKEKNAFCPVCGKGFPTNNALNAHIRYVHTDEKPFKCDLCGNTYKTEHNLKNHKSGKRGTCHPLTFVKQKSVSHQNLKSSSESNLSDSNDSYSVPHTQPNHQPPIVFCAEDAGKSMAPVYSHAPITATIHCPPQYLSVINYMDH